MKSRLLNIGICLFIYSSSIGDSWIQKTNVGGAPRTGAIAFALETLGKGYVGTGHGGWNVFLKDFWEYDPVTDVWTQKANYPGISTSGAMAFNIGSLGYVGGGYIGYSGNTAQDLWSFNPLTNNWTQKANLPVGPRAFSYTFTIGTKAYLGGGRDSNGNEYADFWEYDGANDTWVQKTSCGGGPRSIGFGSNTLTKGYTGLGAQPNIHDFWEYNPITDTWAQKANVPSLIYGDAVSFTICEEIYVGTGESSAGPGSTNQWWCYKPQLNIWDQKLHFIGGAREDAVGFALAGKGYLGTGESGLNADSCFSTGLSDFTHQENISIYPNPFNHILNISSTNQDKLIFTLYDITSKKIILEYFSSTISINTMKLNSGIYFCELMKNNTVVYKGKLVKE